MPSSQRKCHAVPLPPASLWAGRTESRTSVQNSAPSWLCSPPGTAAIGMLFFLTKVLSFFSPHGFSAFLAWNDTLIIILSKIQVLKLLLFPGCAILEEFLPSLVPYWWDSCFFKGFVLFLCKKGYICRETGNERLNQTSQIPNYHLIPPPPAAPSLPPPSPPLLQQLGQNQLQGLQTLGQLRPPQPLWEHWPACWYPGQWHLRCLTFCPFSSPMTLLRRPSSTSMPTLSRIFLMSLVPGEALPWGWPAGRRLRKAFWRPRKGLFRVVCGFCFFSNLGFRKKHTKTSSLWNSILRHHSQFMH